AVQVHRLVEAVSHGLADQGVIGHLEAAGNVLLTTDLGRENGGEKVIGAHPLERGRYLAAGLLADDRQGATGVPTPAGGEGRGVENCLTQGILGVAGGDIVEGFFDRKAMLRAKGQDDGVIAGSSLELEIEVDAE